MAKWIKLRDAQELIWTEWLEERPAVIQEMAAKFNLRGDVLYELKTTGQRVTLHSLNEDGTVTVDVLEKFNRERMIPMDDFLDKRVFGVNPADLIECDLPEGVEPEKGDGYLN